jgi:hypothetical protein
MLIVATEGEVAEAEAVVVAVVKEQIHKSEGTIM